MDHPARLNAAVAVTFHYPIHFTRGAFEGSGCGFDRLLQEIHREGNLASVAFALDSGVDAAWPDLKHRLTAGGRLWRSAGPALIVPGGEACKTSRHTIERLYEWMKDLHLDRHAYVVAIGGGAVLDAVGFAAATCHRGLRHIRVPTTVLAQNDSGVGVKNGYNAFDQKNFIGTFAPPSGVLCDFNFLRTLAPRDLRAGQAEALKVALLKDPGFFATLLEMRRELLDPSSPALETAIVQTARLHLDHIQGSGDPFERFSARPLDLGHWAAHRLEVMSNNELRHGEAVAVGLLLDLWASVRIADLNPRVPRAARRWFEELGFELTPSSLSARDHSGRLVVLQGLEEFREHMGGDLNLTLLRDVGQPVQVGAVDPAIFEDAVNWLSRPEDSCD